MFGNKRFKSNPTLDAELNQPPELLKKNLDLICQSFYGSRNRNMDIMDTSVNKLYGLLTNYDSQNYLWLQPSRIKTMLSEIDYHNYLKRINRDGREFKLNALGQFDVGTDCIARYDLDGKWYRALIIGEAKGNKWPVIFIDYGNVQYTANEELAEIINESACSHYHAPMQAVCCRLYNIVPRNPECRKEIDKKMKEFLDIHYDDYVELQVRHVRPDYVVDCDIFLCSNSNTDSDPLYRTHIGQELVDSGLATFADPMAAHAIKIKKAESFVKVQEMPKNEPIFA